MAGTDRSRVVILARGGITLVCAVDVVALSLVLLRGGEALQRFVASAERFTAQTGAGAASPSVHQLVGILGIALTSLIVLVAVGTALALAWRGRPTTPSLLLGLFLPLLVLATGADVLDLSLPLAEPWDAAVFLFAGGTAAMTFFLFSRSVVREAGAEAPSGPFDPPGRTPTLLAAVLLGSSALVLFFAFEDRLHALEASGGPAYALVQLLIVLGLPAASLLILYLMVAGVRRLRAAYRATSPSERRRIAWIVHGFFAALWTLVLLVLVPSVLTGVADAADIETNLPDLAWLLVRAAGTLPALVIVIATAVGVFYSGGLDPDLVLGRTTVYGALAVAFVFIFAAIEALVSVTLQRLLSFPAGVGTVLAAGLSALAVAPLRKRARRLIDGILPEEEPTQRESAAA